MCKRKNIRFDPIPFGNWLRNNYVSISVLNLSGFPIDYRSSERNTYFSGRRVRWSQVTVLCSLILSFSFFSLSSSPPPLSPLYYRFTLLGSLFVVPWLQTPVPPCCQRPYKHFARLFHEREEASVISADWTDFALGSFLSLGTATRDRFDSFASFFFPFWKNLVLRYIFLFTASTSAVYLFYWSSCRRIYGITA